jgi:hypothetical protein
MLTISTLLIGCVCCCAGAQLLLERSKNLVLPKNPLDDLIDRLGGPNEVSNLLQCYICCHCWLQLSFIAHLMLPEEPVIGHTKIRVAQHLCTFALRSSSC